MSEPQFWDSLDLRVVPEGYLLLKDFTFYSNVAKQQFTAPEGFVSDLASIPRLLRWAFTGHGKSREPAVTHDWLYHNYHDRKEADEVFREALKVAGMNWFKRQAMYAAVRAGGWLHYSRRN